MSRRLSDECLSDLELDHLLLDALGEREAERAQTHLASCAACRSRKAELAHELTLFRQEPPRLPSARAPRRTPRSLYVGALALAAGLAAFWLTRPALVPPGTPTASPSDVVAIKGSRHELVAVIERDGHQVRAVSGDLVRPNDRVQLAYSTLDAADLYVIGVDGGGKAQRYFPDAEHAARVAPGREVELPFSIVLDQTPGKERFYAFFCNESADPHALDVASEAAASAGKPPSFPGCEAASLELEKPR